MSFGERNLIPLQFVFHSITSRQLHAQPTHTNDTNHAPQPKSFGPGTAVSDSLCWVRQGRQGNLRDLCRWTAQTGASLLRHLRPPWCSRPVLMGAWNIHQKSKVFGRRTYSRARPGRRCTAWSIVFCNLHRFRKVIGGYR